MIPEYLYSSTRTRTRTRTRTTSKLQLELQTHIQNMKFSSLCMLASVAAHSKAAKNVADLSYVKLDFDKYYGETFETAKRGRSQADIRVNKRANGYEEVQITNQNSFYSVTLEVGTPPQSVVVLVDTGSSDLWITGSDNPYCRGSTGTSGKNMLLEAELKRALEDARDIAKERTTLAPRDDEHNDGLLSWLTGSDGLLGGQGGTTITLTDSAQPTAAGTSNGARATINCAKYGTFDTSKSSTWHSNDTAFMIQYGDSTFASGTWGMDNLHLSDLNVTGLSFAVANRTNSTVGVLGIGLPALEVTYSGRTAVSGQRPYQYDNFPLVLLRNGAIKSNSYSLFLNNASAETGSVLFGAVDHSKYLGDLYTIPMVNTYASQGYKNPIQFEVTLNGLGISSSSDNTTITTTKIPALLDSGTTLTYLPQALVTRIVQKLQATYSNRAGYYVFSCPSQSDDTEVVFDFGGFHINAPITNFIIGSSGDSCILGIMPQSGGGIILGDSFLNSAYVVYDLENYEISMAQANYAGGQEDIEVISSSVPGAVRAPGFSSTWSTLATSFNTQGDIFTVQAAATVSGSATNTGTGRATATGNSNSTRSTTSRSRTSATSTRSDSQKKNDASRTSFTSTLLFVAGLLVSFI